jgi:hypothetical protein
MALAAATEDAMLSWVLGSPFPAPPGQVWLALHSDAVPSLSNEITGWAGGDRVRVTAADFTAPANATGGGRERVNNKAMLLGIHRVTQTVKSFGLWDAATGGQLLLSGDVLPDVVVNAGDPPCFFSGDLSLRSI